MLRSFILRALPNWICETWKLQFFCCITIKLCGTISLRALSKLICALWEVLLIVLYNGSFVKTLFYFMLLFFVSCRIEGVHEGQLHNEKMPSKSFYRPFG